MDSNLPLTKLLHPHLTEDGLTYLRTLSQPSILFTINYCPSSHVVKMREDIPSTPTEIPISGAWIGEQSQHQIPGFRLIPPPFSNSNRHPEPPSSGKLTQSTQATQPQSQPQPSNIDRMSAQKDMQDLLRLLTTGRNKVPMLQAMGRVKALQTANLRR